MARTIRDIGPSPRDSAWREAQGLLAASETRIGHIDTGLFPHKTLGYDDAGRPPANILLDEGLNVFDPGGPAGNAPVTDLRKSQSGIAALSEYPDHGVKTLSIILANRPGELIGVAPEAKIIPYRVANGPVFIGDTRTDTIGAAIDHALDQAIPPRVFSISMGNPGALGLFEFLRGITGGRAGMDKGTTRAINRAYEEGVIIICAGGQIIKQLAYPARFARTIAVGGITGTETHYPEGGYKNSAEPDVWCYASHINRASGTRLPDGTLRQEHADDPVSEDQEASGTSYAAPQVAAAAAMWVTRWSVELNALQEPWRVVEAFRYALRTSARHDHVRLSPNNSATIPVRRLDIEALMRTAPSTAWPLRKRGAASHFWSYF